MNKREACEWVHTRLIVDEMLFDDLVAAFTALVGRVPNGPDRRDGLFRRCYEIVTSSTDGLVALPAPAHPRARKSSAN